MKKAGISKSVMVNMLPLAEMQASAVEKLPPGLSKTEREKAVKEVDSRMLGRLARRNEWTCSVGKEHPALIPFINLDPMMDEKTMMGEIADKVKNYGAKGIKLHPGSQRHMPDDRRLWPGYKTAEQMGLPVISHAGTFATPVQYAEPKNFTAVLDAFPKLTLVMAHMGMGFFDEVRTMAKKYPNLCFDCCAIVNHAGAAGAPSKAELTSLIKEVGVERVMFGSDFPWFDPAVALKCLLSLNFTEREKRLLLAENAIRIYKL